MDERTYTVVGMSCSHCVRAVEDELGRVSGVAEARVDLATGLLVVRGDGLDDAALRAAVDEAGYVVA